MVNISNILQTSDLNAGIVVLSIYVGIFIYINKANIIGLINK